MTSIMVIFKDGTKKDFPYKGRSGGSYSNSIRYEGGMAIVKDEYGDETAFPISDIKEVKVDRN